MKEVFSPIHPKAELFSDLVAYSKQFLLCLDWQMFQSYRFELKAVFNRRASINVLFINIYFVENCTKLNCTHIKLKQDLYFLSIVLLED